MGLDRISIGQARRLALAAQGFGNRRSSGRVDTQALCRMVDRLGVLQIDPINVVCRSHYLPLYARLGPYPRQVLDHMAWGGRDRDLFEYWAHEASLLPVTAHALMRWRMDRAVRWDWASWSPTTGLPAGWSRSLDPAIRLAPWAVIVGMTRIAKERPSLVDEVLEAVGRSGPITGGDPRLDGRPYMGMRGSMWNWRDAKIALEWLFFTGRLTTAYRGTGFQRVYDLADRALPPHVVDAPAVAEDEAQRELIRIASRAQGIATARQLWDYFHLPSADARVRIAELVDGGELIPAKVEGVTQPVYVWHEAEDPPRVQARALLSPFDSLIWDRDRALKLFGFHYRISIYTRAAERTDGYYVMPFLLGERLLGRVDLRADRKTSALVVPVAQAEPGARLAEVAGELANELRMMAGWLELDSVMVCDRGNLGAALSAALRTGRRRQQSRSSAVAGPIVASGEPRGALS